MYFFPSHLFTFYSSIQSLLTTVKWNRGSEPILIEQKMVHGLNQVVLLELKISKS